MRNIRTFVALSILFTVLAGCASIPISTALHLSSLTPRSLAQIDPAQVRVRLSVSAGHEIDVPKSRLKLTLTDSNKVASTADMPLDLLYRTAGKRPGGLFSADIPVTTYELALTPEGTHQLRVLQQALLAAEHGEFKFTVSAPFSRAHPGQEATFWADLKLSAKEAYFSLIEGARLRFTAEAVGS